MEVRKRPCNRAASKRDNEILGKMSSASLGSMKTFANGVAVYPTYCARGSIVSRSEIRLLIAVRSTWSAFHLFGLLVLTDAWSDSSSMISAGISPSLAVILLRSSSYLLQYRGVLLDHDQACVAIEEVFRMKERKAPLTAFEVKGGDPLLETLIVKVASGQPVDVGSASILRAESMAEEPNPVRIITVVIDCLQGFMVIRIDSSENVFLADQFHVQAALGLGAQ